MKHCLYLFNKQNKAFFQCICCVGDTIFIHDKYIYVPA